MDKYNYTVTLFSEEIKSFSYRYWWVYIVFSTALFIIYYTNIWNIAEIIAMFSIHLLWDIFTMMMLVAYADKKLKLGWIYQIIATFMFILVWIYTGLMEGIRIYLIATSIFGLGSIKQFYYNVYNIDIKFLNLYSIILINAIIIFSYIYLNFDMNLFTWIQTFGFSFFSTSLVMGIKDNQKLKYILWLIWLLFITLGSFLVFIESWKHWKIIGADISFALLPLTILLVQIGLWKNYFSKKI